MARLARGLRQIDVFCAHPYLGNPLAVVLDGSGLSDDAMQRFARWTHLAETTFVLPPSPGAAAAGADYRVRIFSPGYEMPFAGHPTLGTCHAWLEAGGVPRAGTTVLQECQAGLIRIRQTATASGRRLAFAAPALTRSAPVGTVCADFAAALGLPSDRILAAQHLCNGPRHFGLLVDSAATVLALEPDRGALARVLQANGTSGIGVASMEYGPDAPLLIARSNREARAFGQRSAQDNAPAAARDTAAEVRFFFDALGVVEDTVTGSFQASLAQWLMEDGYAPERYEAAQGRCTGGDGRVYVERDSTGTVWIGGDTVTCIAGEVWL